jgi:hypothetical protein
MDYSLATYAGCEAWERYEVSGSERRRIREGSITTTLPASRSASIDARFESRISA